MELSWGIPTREISEFSTVFGARENVFGVFSWADCL